MTLMGRSKKLLESEGYLVDVVERWIPGTHIRKDLFGFGDLLAVKFLKPVLIVQVTSVSNMSSRRKKIRGLMGAPFQQGNILVELHGWHKKRNRWECKREVL